VDETSSPNLDTAELPHSKTDAGTPEALHKYYSAGATCPPGSLLMWLLPVDNVQKVLFEKKVLVHLQLGLEWSRGSFSVLKRVTYVHLKKKTL
jgi:hypothetical protein